MLTQIPPDPVNRRHKQALYSKDDGSSISANVEIMTACRAEFDNEEELKRLSDDKQRLETNVKKGFIEESTLF